MANSLTEDDCDSVAEANNLFSTRKGLIALKFKSVYVSMMSFSIPSGCFALVSRNGVDLDYIDENGNRHAIWPAGLHFPYVPWIGVSYLITKQSIVIELPVKACKTKDNIIANLDVTLSFRIMGDPTLGEDSYLVRQFVNDLKPKGLENQLRNANDEIVRSLVRLMDHTEVYGIRSCTETGIDNELKNDKEDDDFSYFLSGSSSSGSHTLPPLSSGQDNKDGNESFMKRTHNASSIIQSHLNRQFSIQGVEIQSVIIKNVSLPKEIQSQMEEKILSSSAKEEQYILRKDTMRSTQMEEDIQTRLQTLREEREQEAQIGFGEITREKTKLNDEISQARKSEAQIREESRVRIENFNAQNDYEIQRVKDATEAEIATVSLKTKKLAVELSTSTKLESETKLADASLSSAIKEAEAAKLLAETERKTKSWTKKTKHFITNLKSVGVFSKLGSNKDLILGSQSDEEINLTLVADKIIEDSSGVEKEPSPTSVAAELAVLKNISTAKITDAKRGKKEKAFDAFSRGNG